MKGPSCQTHTSFLIWNVKKLVWVSMNPWYVQYIINTFHPCGIFYYSFFSICYWEAVKTIREHTKNIVHCHDANLFSYSLPLRQFLQSCSWNGMGRTLVTIVFKRCNLFWSLRVKHKGHCMRLDVGQWTFYVYYWKQRKSPLYFLVLLAIVLKNVNSGVHLPYAGQVLRLFRDQSLILSMTGIRVSSVRR